ncbi:hypothetical protein ABZT03_05820 [Streptomyces sp. NPDC005574]|uniref:hypothetical protein n=1 Tax=Streptomyces sp. NPDC005574 TaxID=3156891 RepID=UPI0033A68B6E
MLGPQDLSPSELARIMTEELGRPVRYQHQTFEELRSTLLGHGLDETFVDGMVDLKRAKDQGLDSGAARSPQAGPATGFAQWCAQTSGQPSSPHRRQPMPADRTEPLVTARLTPHTTAHRLAGTIMAGVSRCR